MNIILVSGIPGSGKTTITRMLSEELGISRVSKDDIKCELYNRYGFASKEEKKNLDATAEKLLIESIIHFINLSEDVIVDKWFLDTDAILEKSNGENFNIILIELLIDAKSAADRYNARLKDGTRPVALSVINRYPVVNGKTSFEGEKTEEDMAIRIESTPCIKHANSKLTIYNVGDLEGIYNRIKQFVKDQLI